MQIGVVGVSYKNTDLTDREKIAKELRVIKNDNENSVLLSTCNRVELYFSGQDFTCDLKNIAYSCFGLDCFCHLARVASGLESAMLGETEVKRQVKEDYELSAKNGLSSDLHFLFQKSLKISKKVRSNFDFSLDRVDISEIILDICAKKPKTVLFIGNSTINRQLMDKFASFGVKNINICSRDLYDWQDYDLVILASKSPDFIISKPPENAKKKPILVDLSVPRSVDPKIGESLSLFNIDQINEMLEKSQILNLTNLFLAEDLVKSESTKCFNSLISRCKLKPVLT